MCNIFYKKVNAGNITVTPRTSITISYTRKTQKLMTAPSNYPSAATYAVDPGPNG